MSSLMIRNAVLDGASVNIFCENGLIAAIDRTADNVEHEADETLDARGMTAFPPLINSHTHASMTLFRGNGDDLPLMEWLTQRVWPYERGIRDEEIYWGAKLAMVEMIRNGTVFFNDMYWNFHPVAKAVEEMGMRAMIAGVIIDVNDDAATRRSHYERIERQFTEAKQYSDRVQYAVAPHAVYTVSEESYRWCADFCKENDVVLHTHLSETEGEVQGSIKDHGARPVEYLHRIGALEAKLIAAHTVWLTDSDIALLGEYGVVCSHNPVSNMKLAVNGVYPYRKLKQAGAVTAIATDGAGSNNSLDLFQDMKIAALLQKLHQNDPTAITAEELLDMATENPASFFSLGGRTLEVGRQADLILIDTGLPEMNPPHDFASHLVYSATGSVVDSVVCDGQVLMEHRQIEGMEEIIAKANEAARSLFARVDEA